MRKPTRFIALTAALLISVISFACGKKDTQTVIGEGTLSNQTEGFTYADVTSPAESDTAQSGTDKTETENSTANAEEGTTHHAAQGNGEKESVTDGDFTEAENTGSDTTKPQNASGSQNTEKPQQTEPQQAGTQEQNTSASETQKPAESATQKPAASQAPKPTTPVAQETTKPQQEKPTSATAVTPIPSGGDFSKTAAEVAIAMGDGINLGNTMEATAGGNPWFDVTNVTNWETAWGQPKTTRAMIDGMKKAGFESIRIPVAWSNMMSTDGSYEIPKVFFDRVDEIIGYAYANNMYVIINIHYDGGWWDDFAKDEAGTMKRYKAMWSQIAGHYKDYDDKLIFESANEELGDNLGYALVNRINQAFVDLVRASGGNNGVRYLLIAGYNTDIDKTCSSSFKMPSDTCKNHLLISVHYYTPWTYCGMWKDESWGKADYDWGTDADKAEMEKYFKKMQKFTDAGYGVIIGEYSALPNYSNNSYTRKDGSAEFLSYVRSLSAKYGYAAYLWDTGDWYNKYSCSMRWSDTESLYR